MSRVLVELRRVVKEYAAGVAAVREVNLDIYEGEFLTLLGPSGSGKTTTLMLIAGFEELTAGSIRVRGRSVGELPPEKRDVGMVFQNYALFPHMTVFDNVAFPLRMRRTPRDEIARRVQETLATVRLQGFERRLPRQLSGGQQQRVALARALVFRPSLLLMDEPLAALDRKLREQMQAELKAIQRELGVTTLYVTHDQQEALTLSDRIGVMNRGALVQVGAPVDVYDRPVDRFTAEFLGEANLVDGRVTGIAEGVLRVAVAADVVIEAELRVELPRGTKVCLMARPEALELRPRPEGGPDEWPGVVRDAVFLGDIVRYAVELAEGVVLRVARPYRRDAAPLKPGQRVTVAGAPRAWAVFPGR
jgi:spermidine/putrescine ABC transporter ATP-binding subunit